MDKDIIKTTFYQYLTPINFEKVAEILLSLDKYVKKLTTEKLIMLLIFGQLFSKTSLTELSTDVKNDDDLQKILKLESISTSQLSRKLTPDKIVITPAKGADKTKMDDLVVTTAKDALHVFERAYVDYQKFDEYCENGTIFLSRLKSNALVKIISAETKIIDSKEVTESIVILGKENATRMNNNLRLLEIPDDNEPGKIIRIITNDFNRSTQELSDFYRNRWQIELFFKWIKQHLHVKKFYGISKNAVKNQILSAMVAYLLLCLFKKEVKSHLSLFNTLRLLAICKYEALEKFIEKLKRPPTKTSKGRRKLKHQEIFNLTYKQVMSGDTELLNSTEFNPVIL